MTMASQNVPLANGLQPLSCVRCARRKVRCDRIVPCNNCTRHETDCEYPQPRTQRRRRRSAIKLSSVCSTPQSQGIVPRQDHVEASPSTSRMTSDKSLDGMDFAMPDEQATPSVSRRNSSIADIQKQLRPLPHEPELTSVVSQPSILTLGVPPGTLSAGDLWPPHDHFNILWKVYLCNVHPITMVLHAPTASEAVHAASRGQRITSEETRAFLFAMLTCALASLTASQSMELLGQRKDALYAKYRRGCEIALANANFLASRSLLVLQAYAIYLLAIRADKDAHEFWSMAGIAKRNAHRLGIHSETETAKMTPFQMEIRRRLWMCIVMLDEAAAQAAGGVDSVPSSDEVRCFPTANDSELSPSMQRPPETNPDGTDMLFCILLYKVNKFMNQVHSEREPWSKSIRDAAAGQSQRAEQDMAIDLLQKDLELEFLRHCDMLKPAHFLAILFARLIVCKLRCRIQRVDGHFARSGTLSKEDQSYFLTAIKVLEYECNLRNQPIIQGFAWFTEHYLQSSSLLDVLEILQTQPSGDLSDKAWEQIHQLYKCELEAPNRTKPSILEGRVREAVLSAWGIREAWCSEHFQALETPFYITLFREQPTGQMEDVSLSALLSDQSSRSLPDASRVPAVSDAAAFPNAAADMGTWPAMEDDAFVLDPALQSGESINVGQLWDASTFIGLSNLDQV